MTRKRDLLDVATDYFADRDGVVHLVHGGTFWSCSITYSEKGTNHGPFLGRGDTAHLALNMALGEAYAKQEVPY